MPSKTIKQRQLMAIAEHNPSAVYPENRSVLKMSHRQLHEFAATKGIKPRRLSKGAATRMRARANWKASDGG